MRTIALILAGVVAGLLAPIISARRDRGHER